MKRQTLQIKDLGKIITGKTPSTSNNSFFDGQFPFVTPTDITFDNYYCRKTETTVTEAAKYKQRNQFIPPNSVMVTCIGSTIGKCALSSEECLTNQQINSIVPFDIYDPKYVYYLMIYNIEVIRGIGLSGGVAAPIINKTAFERIKITVLPKYSRDKIANILSTYDDLIDTNRRRIQLLEESARLLFREWFVYFHFPGHEKVKIVDGVPEGWITSMVGKCISFISRGPSLNYISEDEDGGIPVLNQRCIRNSEIELEAIEYAKELSIRQKELYLKQSDILINSMGVGTLGRVSRNLSINYPMIIHNCITVMRAKKQIIKQTVLFYRLSAAQTYLEMMGLGSTGQSSLKKEAIERIKILIPSQELQNYFDIIIKPMWAQIGVLKKQNQKLAQARDLLLPRLMSGKIEV